MKWDYRVVTNGHWYEIEYKPKWWPFWFRHTRSSVIIEKERWIRFDTLKDAVVAIEKLRKADEAEKWTSIIVNPYITEDGKITAPIIEGTTRGNIKERPNVGCLVVKDTFHLTVNYLDYRKHIVPVVVS